MPSLPFIPFANCAEVVIQLTQQAIPWILTFGMEDSVPITLAELSLLFTAIDTWVTTDLSGQVSGNCSIDFIKLTDLTTVSGPTFQNPTTTNAGSLAGTVIPAQAALVTSLYTNNRGRSFRGRSYLAGRVAGDQQTVTTWTAVRVAAVQAMYANLVTAINAAGWNLVVLSRQNASVRRTVGVATTVRTIVSKVPIATQRRRLL